MKKSFHNATQSGGGLTDTWLTPQWLIDAIKPQRGFDLDPCGYLPNGEPIVRTANNYFTEQDDGLQKKWFGNVFVNFPYSDSKAWLEKCKNEFIYNGHVLSITVLCFVRSETKAWQENVKVATGINLINKRIKFLDATGTERGNGNAPSCLICFGSVAYERAQNVDGIYLTLDNPYKL